MIYKKLYMVNILLNIWFLISLKKIFTLNIVDVLRTIRDPEKPCTLEDLKVVYEEGIIVQPSTKSNVSVVCLKHYFAAYLKTKELCR